MNGAVEVALDDSERYNSGRRLIHTRFACVNTHKAKIRTRVGACHSLAMLQRA